MPVIFRYKGCRFLFYSNEGVPPEPPHVHVRQGAKIAKFWLRPEVKLADSHGFGAAELNDFAREVESQREFIERKWNEHFGHLA